MKAWFSRVRTGERSTRETSSESPRFRWCFPTVKSTDLKRPISSEKMPSPHHDNDPTIWLEKFHNLKYSWMDHTISRPNRSHREADNRWIYYSCSCHRSLRRGQSIKFS